MFKRSWPLYGSRHLGLVKDGRQAALTKALTGKGQVAFDTHLAATSEGTLQSPRPSTAIVKLSLLLMCSDVCNDAKRPDSNMKPDLQPGKVFEASRSNLAECLYNFGPGSA